MSAQVPQYLIRTFLVLIVASLAVSTARPSHFGETNQVVSEQESNNLLDSDLKSWPLEPRLELLAQRLREMNGQQAGGVDLNHILNGNYWEREIRSPENKRQSRYRQCYFNPISCFRK